MDQLDEIRELLKEHDISISEDELQKTVTEFQYLSDVWLDEVERELFGGKTLNELLIHSDV